MNPRPFSLLFKRSFFITFKPNRKPFYSPLERDRERHSTIKFFLKNNHFKNRSRKKCQLCEKLISGRDMRLSISIHVSFFERPWLQQFFIEVNFYSDKFIYCYYWLLGTFGHQQIWKKLNKPSDLIYTYSDNKCAKISNMIFINPLIKPIFRVLQTR